MGKFHLQQRNRRSAPQLLPAQTCMELIDSIDGAKSSAIVYSITETAKANNLNPFRYLEYVLTVMKDHSGRYGLPFYGRPASMVWTAAGNLPEQNKNNECVNRPPETAVKK